MDFKDSVLQLSDRIRKQTGSIATEEATKNAFVMPLIMMLGYDVFNPLEVVPEMDCDLIKKKGEKIDYAIFKNGEPIILIECKHCKQDLVLHDTQLQKYFVASKARFGVLTNGVEYRFYTDLEKPNLMDEKPFLVINLLDLSDNDIEELKKFHKSYYNETDILSNAEQLQILVSLREIINKDFQNPSSEFVRYFIREINENRSTARQIEQYTPLVKKAIGNHINDVISDRLSIAIKKEEKQEDAAKEVAQKELPEGVVFQDEETGVVTTQEEIDSYNIVRGVIRKDVDISLVSYADFKSYFAMYYDRPYKWICRFYFGRKLFISFPLIEEGKGEERIEIQTIDDIFKYADKLIEVAKLRKG